jgi:ubiquinone/menaquinone biosynthesis C-methylase UbiE
MRVSALEGHRLWAPTYDAALNPVVALESRIMADLLRPISTKCFVDVGCGTGRWMLYVRECGAHAFGADASLEMLEQASRKRLLEGKLALADAGKLPFRSGAADVTICAFSAAYFPSLKNAVAEMARITKYGGRIVLSDLHPAGIAAGWTRSFRLGASVYEMEHLNPSLDEFHAAGREAGLHLHMQVEATFGDPERLIFRTAGREHMFAALSSVPAVWIGIWNKV